jgi:hypothetical protein
MLFGRSKKWSATGAGRMMAFTSKLPRVRPAFSCSSQVTLLMPERSK